MVRTVFLSYRREESAGHAGRLYDWLNQRFTGRVFRDVGTIAPGDDFVTAIQKGVGECQVLIALIGKQWLSEGRLNDPADFVRVEIATAFKRRIRVIPVLVGGATLPNSRDLPPDIAELCRRQAIELSDAGWEADCERLTSTLEVDLGPATGPTRRSNSAIVVASLSLVAVVGVFIVYALSGGREQVKTQAPAASPVAMAPATPPLTTPEVTTPAITPRPVTPSPGRPAQATPSPVTSSPDTPPRNTSPRNTSPRDTTPPVAPPRATSSSTTAGSTDGFEEVGDEEAKRRLVGTWVADVVELGVATRIVWRVTPDGRSSYTFTTAAGRATGGTMWTYSDGELSEQPLDGTHPSSASIKWSDVDHFVLTIIDIGDPRATGFKRRYARQKPG